MSQVREESRRSTRVPLKVVITAHGLNERLTCDGDTIVVNRHGARIPCAIPLHTQLRIEIYVVITGKRAEATVVYVDPDQPFLCGVALDKPENIGACPCRRMIGATRRYDDSPLVLTVCETS